MYHVPAVAINGSMTYDQRAKVVNLFKTDPDCRVLVFSKVGTVGLNLTEADTIILLVSKLEHLSFLFSPDIYAGPAVVVC
jgi:TATA-binding protein-associated factor